MFESVKRLFRQDPDRSAEAWHRQCELTPDIWYLEQHHRQLIFVADDLMSDHRHNRILTEASASGVDPIHPYAYTVDDYKFYLKDLGKVSHPVLMEKDAELTGFVRFPPEPAQVKGELWSIRPYQFIKLDKLRQNGVQFVRKRVSIFLPAVDVVYTKAQPNPKLVTANGVVRAWMYVGIPEYWDTQLGGVFATKAAPIYEHDHPIPEVRRFYKFE
jgi:hypothetical protein